MAFAMNVDRRTCLRGLLALAGGAAVAGAGPALAAEGRLVYEGQVFDTRLRVAGVELRLNGTGVRQVAWFKGYLAALYLVSPASTAAQAVAMGGPKRIQMRMLHDVPAAEFSKAMRKGIARNTPAPALGSLGERIERFSRQIDAAGAVRDKDVVDLDLDPSRGLVWSINGRPRGDPIPGEDFYAALLRSFVGEVPYDKRMRAGLLGQAAG